MKDDALLGYKGHEFYDTGVIYAPYTPVIKQSTWGPMHEGVYFHEYDPEDENPILKTRYRAMVQGFEQEDGTVIVHKKGKELKGRLKNKEAFISKYFTEAV
jgi:hypothetical protein